MNFEFNPNSGDSNFSEIPARLGGQDVGLRSILEQAVKTNGRVSSLQAFRAIMLVLGVLRMLVPGAVASAVARCTIWAGGPRSMPLF